MKKLIIDGKSLDIDSLYEVAIAQKGKLEVSISDSSKKEILRSRKYVDDIVQKAKPVYGINTGFGALSNKFIQQEDLATLQYNLIRSHCTGVGQPFPKITTRAIMLLRANCLASGFSGVSIECIELLLDFLNHHITPVVPEKGSVGASGDLAPLSHIALCLIGEGEVEYNGKTVPASFAIEDIGKEPVQLKAKDGLALINGTAVMAALGSLALHEAKRLIKIADIATAMTLEAVRGTKRAYDPDISSLKPQPGQLDVADNLTLLLTEESEIAKSHIDCGKVQDPYSLRCVPQVHGAIRQTIKHAEEVLKVEINSVTDNPLIFVDKDKVVSGGNFHGEAVAFCMDYLTMGLSEIANISERRVEKMMNPTFSDLPAFLIKESGLNSGLMIAHVTMAALASENKYLSHPAVVDSIPTSTDKEDHVSMGVTSGRKLHEVIRNVKACLAIEFLCNTQGIYLLRPLKSTSTLEKVYNLIRNHVPAIDKDRVFKTDIENIIKLISNFEILNVVEADIGELK
ncbi:MAG: histidine ammonia-lyase [Halobacteriovoraceae bacterium]|nr:histidine ammonia-lyase [Halobacteriovoraceae bacterium]|tara:strand:- start:25485 stop:27026 length:1542 start_codon:yes stop_codon:yes gene_type:complete